MSKDNGTPAYRCQITITIPLDGNVEIGVDGGGVVELFAAAALLERSAHRILASAERESAMKGIVPVTAMPEGLSS